MSDNPAKAPVHLWIIGIAALLWNAMGAFDYAATKLQVESYLSQFTPEQLDYFTSFPAWVVAAWAIAVWTAPIGSIGLLMRKAWAVWLFGISIVGMVITSIYNFVLSNGLEIMGTEGVIFSAVIWMISFGLFFYARAMAMRGVLSA